MLYYCWYHYILNALHTTMRTIQCYPGIKLNTRTYPLLSPQTGHINLLTKVPSEKLFLCITMIIQTRIACYCWLVTACGTWWAMKRPCRSYRSSTRSSPPPWRPSRRPWWPLHWIWAPKTTSPLSWLVYPGTSLCFFIKMWFYGFDLLSIRAINWYLYYLFIRFV